MFDVNTSVIAAECLKMFGVCDVAETVATRKDRFVKRYVLSSSVVCEICSICSYVFFLVYMYYMCYRFSVNKDVCVCVV